MNIEEAKELKQSLLWNEGIVPELEKRIENTLNLVLTCSPDMLVGLQQRVKVLKELKRLPQDVIDRESS
jgi:hypothetical protein